MTSPDNIHHAGEGLAPKLQIPSRAVSVVEHPCIVKNVDKGVVSLGGEVKLSKALRSKPEDAPELENDDGEAASLRLPHFISVSLRPDDPYAKRLLSNPVTTNNVLLKVTVPKRTGRKRKLGSSGPFLAEPEMQKTPLVKASEVFRSISDNPSRFTVTPAGVLDEAHRFRNVPDIQYAASRDSTMNDIVENIIPLRYSKLKNYKLSTVPGADLSKTVPPAAEFIQMAVAYNYKFQQNAFVKYTGDDREEVNTGKRLATNGYYFIKNDEPSPLGPKPDLPPEDTLTPYIRSLIMKVRAELARRPVITRHMLYNTIGWDKRDQIREHAVYCGYFFGSGPFREALIAWGVDPRTDPEYRQYQTVSFVSFKKPHSNRHGQGRRWDKHLRDLMRGVYPAKDLRKSHTFDGVHAPVTGGIFQFCDISDPLIRRVLDTKDIRTSCAATSQGWFHAGTWAKATVILKDKLNRIVMGETPDNSLYDRAITWPEKWDDKEIYATYRLEMYDKELHKEKKQEHDLLNYVRYAAKSPRYAFERLERIDEITQDGGVVQDAEDGGEEVDVDVPEDMTEIPDDAEAVMNEGGDVDSGATDNEDENGEDDEDEDADLDVSEDEDGLESGDDSDEASKQAERQARPFGGLFTNK